MVSGKPALMADLWASEKPPTTEAPRPNPWTDMPTIMEPRLFLKGRYLNGPWYQCLGVNEFCNIHQRYVYKLMQLKIIFQFSVEIYPVCGLHWKWNMNVQARPLIRVNEWPSAILCMHFPYCHSNPKKPNRIHGKGMMTSHRDLSVYNPNGFQMIWRTWIMST